MLPMLGRLVDQRNAAHIASAVPSLVLLAAESPLLSGFPQQQLTEQGHEIRVRAKSAIRRWQ